MTQWPHRPADDRQVGTQQHVLAVQTPPRHAMFWGAVLVMLRNPGGHTNDAQFSSGVACAHASNANTATMAAAERMVVVW